MREWALEDDAMLFCKCGLVPYLDVLPIRADAQQSGGQPDVLAVRNEEFGAIFDHDTVGATSGDDEPRVCSRVCPDSRASVNSNFFLILMTVIDIW